MLNKPDLCSGDYLENAWLSFPYSIERSSTIGLYYNIIQMTEYNCTALFDRVQKTLIHPSLFHFFHTNTTRLQLPNSPNIIPTWPSSQPAVPPTVIVMIYFFLFWSRVECEWRCLNFPSKNNLGNDLIFMPHEHVVTIRGRKHVNKCTEAQYPDVCML